MAVLSSVVRGRRRAVPPPGPPDVLTPELQLLGRSWTTRGTEYRVRRTAVTSFLLAVVAVELVVLARVTVAAMAAAGPVGRFPVAALAVGLVGYVVVRARDRRTLYRATQSRAGRGGNPSRPSGPRPVELGLHPQRSGGGAEGLLGLVFSPVSLVATLAQSFGHHLSARERDCAAGLAAWRKTGRRTNLAAPPWPTRRRRPLGWTPGHAPPPDMPLVGTSWVRRGPSYWVTRVVWVTFLGVLTVIFTALAAVVPFQLGSSTAVHVLVAVAYAGLYVAGLRYAVGERRRYWFSPPTPVRPGASGFGMWGIGALLVVVTVAPVSAYLLIGTLSLCGPYASPAEREASEYLRGWERRTGRRA